MKPYEPLISLGLAISQKRKSLGLSQEELAEKANLHRTYISDIERGEKNLSIISFLKICHALDTSASQIFQSFERIYHHESK